MLHAECRRCLAPPAPSPPVQVRELIYREILEYHPHMLADFLAGNRQQPSFLYPSAVDNFKRSFAHLEGGQLPPGAGGECLHRRVCPELQLWPMVRQALWLTSLLPSVRTACSELQPGVL